MCHIKPVDFLTRKRGGAQHTRECDDDNSFDYTLGLIHERPYGLGKMDAKSATGYAFAHVAIV